MLNVRNHPDARFNVLLAEDLQHAPEHWTRQLPRLLEPQGVRSYVARTGSEAVEIVQSVRIHAAVIDVDTPPSSIASRRSGASGSAAAGGLWLLDVLRRVQHRPPVVVVNDVRLSPVQVQRLLNEALRLGAFSVINRPDDLEHLLAVMRRLLDRTYRGQWPPPEGDPNVENPGEPARRS
jgi:DNA-binding response OmpR family regulator